MLHKRRSDLKTKRDHYSPFFFPFVCGEGVCSSSPFVVASNFTCLRFSFIAENCNSQNSQLFFFFVSPRQACTSACLGSKFEVAWLSNDETKHPEEQLAGYPPSMVKHPEY